MEELNIAKGQLNFRSWGWGWGLFAQVTRVECIALQISTYRHIVNGISMTLA